MEASGDILGGGGDGIANNQLQNMFMHSTIVDEDYLVVAAHIDDTLNCRIRAGEYVDFTRLLPWDRVQMEQDNRLQILNFNGQLSCAPVNETNVTITSFARWE